MLAIVFSVLFSFSFNSQAYESETKESEVHEASKIVVNPYYKGTYTKEDIEKLITSSFEERENFLSDTQTVKFVYSVEDACESLFQQFKERKQLIRMNLRINKEYDLNALMDMVLNGAFSPTENSWEGDYYHGEWIGGNLSVHSVYYYGAYNYYLTYELVYRTSAQQEKQVDEKVQYIIKSFGFNDSTTEYQKVCKIYDCLCSNITYDREHDDDYLQKYTAYAALVQGTCV